MRSLLWHGPAVRLALLLTILAACGGGDTFSIDPVSACASCGPGHVVAGARTDVDVRFAADGARVVAGLHQHVAWLDPSLAIAASADTDLDGSHYSSEPTAVAVVSAPDGHAFAIAGGQSSDQFGSSMTFFGLDSGGHPRWKQTFVGDDQVPPTWISLAPSGDLRVIADATTAAMTLAETKYSSWVVRATLAAADGSVVDVRTYPATGVRFGASAPTPDGGLLIAGTLTGSITLGGAVGAISGSTLTPTIFLAKLDAKGDGAWAKTWAGGGPVTVTGLATDGDRIYVAGAFTTSLDLRDGAMLTGTADAWTDYVVAVTGAGANAWSLALPTAIGYPTIAITPKGVLLAGGYLSATTLDGMPLPAATSQVGLCAELVDGHVAWMLRATGTGNHLCRAIGLAGGHTYVELGAADTDQPAHTDIDGLAIDGQTRMVLEVATAP